MKSVLLLSMLVIISFYPALHNGFTNLDDYKYLFTDPQIRVFSVSQLKSFFFGFQNGNYMPLTMATFAIQGAFFGWGPFHFHLINLILHLLNVLLVFWFTLMLTNRGSRAFLIAILFGIHPVRVESVAWISERKDVLYGFFYLTSLICYLYYQKRGWTRGYWVSIFSFVFSLFSKGLAVTLPLMLILIDYLSERPFKRQCVVEKIPFFFLSIFFGVIALYGQKEAGAIKVKPDFLYQFFIACYGTIFYLKNMIWPSNLSSFYPYPHPTGQFSGLTTVFFISPIIVGILLLCCWRFRQNREIPFAWLFFFLNILPVIQFLPAGPVIAADRFTYISSIGPIFLLSRVFQSFYIKVKPFGKRCCVLLKLIFVGYLLALSMQTFYRCTVWQDSISLWSEVIEKYPCASAFEGRAKGFLVEGDLDRATLDIEKALELHPSSLTSLNFLGSLYRDRGEIASAEAVFKNVISLNPSQPEGHNNFGLLFLTQNQFEKALDQFSKAICNDSKFVPALNNRAIVQRNLGKLNESLSDVNQALKLYPGSAQILLNRAMTLVKLGKKAEARSDIEACKAQGMNIPESLLVEVSE